ncbi:hypothetical protein DL96DRAFT_1608439 [Flagelloscypha sp. PMI_526]|nr:hypothetical protein DL96DRAFT_1608439 [Flagelloscypha sp. PMI_526]
MGASSHFCCCLPLRLGAFLISIGQFLVSLATAGLLWASLYLATHPNTASQLNIEGLDYSMRYKISTGVYAGLNTLAVFSCLFGFFGILRAKLSWVKQFATTMSFLFGLNLGFGIVHTVLFFLESENLEKECVKNNANVAQSTSQDTLEDICGWSVKAYKIAFVVFTIISVLISAYGWFIVGSYAKKLQKDSYHKHARALSLGSGEPISGYGKPGSKDIEAQPFVQPAYPFTEPDVGYTKH